jgi:uncharacterized membrane protein YqjE
MSAEAEHPRPRGLVDSIARLGRTALAMARTRLDILATELEEERIRFAQLALAVAIIVFCLQISVLLFVGLVVVLFWEASRLWVLGGLAALFLVAGIAGLAIVRHRLRNRPKMFATTIAELTKDEARLEGDAQ